MSSVPIYRVLLPLVLLAGIAEGQETNRVPRPVTPAVATMDFPAREAQASPAIQEELASLRQQVAAQGLPFQIGYTGAMDFPLNQITGLITPADLPQVIQKRGLERAGASLRVLSARTGACSATARSFDWRQAHGATPVRDQGNCGSCWAFAANGAFEGALRIRDGLATGLDTSEQDTLDCSQGGDCTGGWWDHALGYMLSAGSAAEASYPYTAKQNACKKPNVSRVFHAADWDYVPSSSVSDLKQALCEHGPLAVAVTATPLFSAYTGGVFKEPKASKFTNHAVTLIGWNDADHAWIIKNSWGTGWGETAGYGTERGYMRIAYGSNSVGSAGTWVDASSAAQLETDTTWRSIAPVGNQTAADVRNVGAAWEGSHPGWNTAATFDDSDAAGWKSAVVDPTKFAARPDISFIWAAPAGSHGTPAYFRKQFVLNAVPNVAHLTVMTYDDALVYLNGQLVLSDTDHNARLQFLDVTPYVRAGSNIIAVKVHHAVGIREGLYLALTVGAHQVANSAVTFQIKPGTKRFTASTVGCPANAGYVGKETWTGVVTNVQNAPLSDIFIEIANLSNDNLFLTTGYYQSQYLGTGDIFPVVWQDAYYGQLTHGESAEVPFTVCVKNRKPYQLVTNVLGVKN